MSRRVGDLLADEGTDVALDGEGALTVDDFGHTGSYVLHQALLGAGQVAAAADVVEGGA